MSAADFDGVRWKQFAAIQDGGFGVGFPFSAAQDPHNRAANCYVGRLNKAAAYKHLKISESQTPHSPLSRKFS